MRLRKNTKKLLFTLSVFLSLIFLFVTTSFASPGIKITKPLNGSTVTPGQQITVTIEAVNGFAIKQGFPYVQDSKISPTITALPATYTDNISMKAVGNVHIGVIAQDASGNTVGDDVTLKVQQTANLQSLTIYSDELLFETDWNGNVKDYDPYKIGGVFGIYSDGIERDLSKDPNTIYSSSDPSVISIDTSGKVRVYKSGDNVKITIANSGVNLNIPVVFEGPRGIKPSQTVPPTTQISIQPTANTAGWYNKDITITITAQAHEPDVIQEIDYEFPYIGKSEDIKGSQAVIPFSQEGINLLRYVAYDNERNSSGQQSTTIQIDKTPPTVSLSLDPYKIKLPFKADGCNFLMPFFYKLSYSATDKLSGVKSINGGIVIPDVTNYKTQLIKKNELNIVVSEKTRHILIASSNPSEILNQLKTNKIVPIDNGQIMHLNEIEKLDTWTITKIGGYLVIRAPSIVFKAQATDNADNSSTKDIKYTKTRIPLPDYVKPLINKKELSAEEIDDLEDDAVIDQDTLKTIRKNYK